MVLKLFNICQPTHAVFGKKDFQQCAVIRRMVRDLDVPIRLVFGATVREADGLALSSRNAYLSPEDRLHAPKLYAALRNAREAVRSGEVRVNVLREQIEKRFSEIPGSRMDYVTIVNRDTLHPLETVSKGTVAAIAVFFGSTRLIDNIELL